MRRLRGLDGLARELRGAEAREEVRDMFATLCECCIEESDVAEVENEVAC